MATEPFEVRPLSFFEMLGQAVRLYRRCFGDCLVAVLAVTGPLYVLNAVLDRAEAQGFLESQAADWWNLGVYGLYLLALVPLQQGIVLPILAGEYLGAPVSRQGAFALAKKRSLRLVWVRMVRLVCVLLGLLALVIPGLWLAVRYYFAEETTLLEDLPPGASLTRSSRLTRHVFGQIAMITLILFLLGAGGFLYLETLADPLLRMGLEIALGVLLAPLELACSCVLYFSARCSEDQFDLELAILRMERKEP